MPETRPRYVNPPQDFTTPTFVPDQDPYAGLEAILSNLNNQPVQQPQSKIQTILNMIANAAAVGTAQDPGAALGQLLRQQEQQKMMQQQQMQQRQDQINDLRINVAMRKANQLSEDQQNLKREQRALALRREERQFDLEREREKDQQRLNELAIRRDWDLEDAEKKFRLERKLAKEYEQEMLDMEKRLNDVRKVDTRIANKIELSAKYRLSGIDADMAESIAEAELNGTKLTKEQKAALNKAASEERQMKKEKHAAEVGRLKQLASGSRRSGSGGGSARDIFIDAAKRNLANTIFDTQWVEDNTGRVIDLKNAPKDLFGQPDQTKIKRYLSPEENYTRSAAIAAQLTSKLAPQGAGGQAQPQQQPLPAESGGLERLKAIADDARRQEYPEEEIPKILRKMGATELQIRQVLGTAQIQPEQQPLGMEQGPVMKRFTQQEQQKFGQGPSYEEMQKKAKPIKGKVRISVN